MSFSDDVSRETGMGETSGGVSRETALGIEEEVQELAVSRETRSDSLLPDAELAEDNVKDIIDIDPADQSTQ